MAKVQGHGVAGLMIRHKWTMKLRNQMASLAMECDSAAAIEGAKLTPREREYLQTKLRMLVDYIDSNLPDLN